MLTVQKLENHYIFLDFLQRIGPSSLVRILRIHEKYGEEPFRVELAAMMQGEEWQKWKMAVQKKAKKKAIIDWLRLVWLGFAERKVKSSGKGRREVLRSKFWKKRELTLLKEVIKPQATMLATYELLNEIKLELGEAELDKFEKLFADGNADKAWQSFIAGLEATGENFSFRLQRIYKKVEAKLVSIYSDFLVDLIRLKGV